MGENAVRNQIGRLAIEARQKLRETYVPEQAGHLPDPYVSVLTQAIAKLCMAIEKLAHEGDGVHVLAPADTLDEFQDGQREELEALYASISGYDTKPKAGKQFIIDFPSITLSEDDIWPDGDGPVDPSAEDVVARMKECEDAHPVQVASEWLLIDSLMVATDDDPNDYAVWEGGAV